MQNEMFTKIDHVIEDYIVQHSEMHERWLLQQTLYTGTSRRSLVGMLPIQPGMKVLDLGSGFGATTFDLAATFPVKIEAVDVDSTTMNIAQTLHDRIQAVGAILPDSSIHFVEADAYNLPFEDNSIDFAISRFLFQHLYEPVKAMSELKRVLKPQGFVCVIDVDDQLMITYPEEIPEFRRLNAALVELQQLSGGDRFVGRKIPSYMREAGVNVISTLIQPLALFAQMDSNDFSHQLTLQRFLNARDSMIARGIILAEEFDKCFSRASAVFEGWQYTANGQTVTLGQVPMK